MSIFESFTNRFVTSGSGPQQRAQIGKFQGWISVIVNAVLFIIKFVLGLVTGAISLMADAFHTLSDVVSSAVVIWGFKEVEKPADEEHPYGHGRAEYIATLVISILLSVVGIEFIQSSIKRILDPQLIAVNWWMIAVVAVTIVFKELTARYAEFLSHRISSGTLQADAWHHRTDAISSLLVVIAMIAGRYGFYHLDGYAGVGVALIILWTAFEIARDAIDDLIGKPPTDEELEAIRQAAIGIDGVLGTHDITVHSYGSDKYVSVHIEVDARQHTLKTHDIAEAVEVAIDAKLNVNPTVHIDPVYTDHPLINEIKDFLQADLKNESVITSFHDVRIVDTADHKVILFGMNLNPGATPRERKDRFEELKNKLEARFQGFRLIMKISPIHKYA
ncbi:MAG: cation transporter [Candidatus Marinimicrobia bacterium]|nr:cation transporter [Candidatus Neomarinimicrobiota bacterium]